MNRFNTETPNARDEEHRGRFWVPFQQMNYRRLSKKLGQRLIGESCAADFTARDNLQPVAFEIISWGTMAHNYDLDDFKIGFASLRERGFVRSRRKGPTGVGHTLEQELGMAENNLAVPDLGQVELKGRRVNSGSMVTLFTFNRKAWQVKPLYAVRTYGSLDKDGRIGLYYTMSFTPNGAGLFLHTETEAISVRHISGEVIAIWDLEQLAAQFMKKIPAVVLVSALSELRDGIEWFRYTRAQLLYGTSPEILREQISVGHVVVDLRLHDQGTRARNHGTGFRTKENHLTQLFSHAEDL